jgi:hypothetical protein
MDIGKEFGEDMEKDKFPEEDVYSPFSNPGDMVLGKPEEHNSPSSRVGKSFLKGLGGLVLGAYVPVSSLPGLEQNAYAAEITQSHISYEMALGSVDAILQDSYDAGLIKQITSDGKTTSFDKDVYQDNANSLFFL